jgi:hypothetical protein
LGGWLGINKVNHTNHRLMKNGAKALKGYKRTKRQAMTQEAKIDFQ